MSQLEGKVAIVTGGGRGLGRAYCEALAREGATVVAADIRDTAKTVEAIRATNGRVTGIALDAADMASCETMAKHAVNEFGRIDVLVNNAALYGDIQGGRFDKISEDEWDRTMAVNVRGVWQCCKACVPAMRDAGGGSIINIASLAAVYGMPFGLHYATSKAAVIGMTRALARELGRDWVRVNAIAPSAVLTEGTDEFFGAKKDKLLQAVATGQSLQKNLTTDDLVGTVLYLASDASRMVTGQTLMGGRRHGLSLARTARARLLAPSSILIGGLPARELGGALFHERGAPLGVVGAGEAGRYQLLAEGRVDSLGAALCELGDHALARAHGERRVGGDAGAVALDGLVKRVVGDGLVDESDALGLRGGEAPRGDEDLLGEGGAHEIGQQLERADAIADSEPRGRDREGRASAGDAQVAGDGEAEAAPHAIAADHGDGRPVRIAEPLGGAFRELVVGRDRLLARAQGRELGDVGARDEGLLAGALEHDHADRGIGFQPVEGLRQRAPHGDGERIVLRRVVEGDPADGAGCLDKQLISHGAFLKGKQGRGGPPGYTIPRPRKSSIRAVS